MKAFIILLVTFLCGLFYVNCSPTKNSNPTTPTTTPATTTTTDTTAPVFTGVTSASSIGLTGLTLNWTSAGDNKDSGTDLFYNIYISTTSSAQVFTTPSFTTAAGATNFAITGLSSGLTYYFVVRAVDKAGNEDSNVVEISATTTTYYFGIRARDEAGNSSTNSNTQSATTNP